MNNLILKKTTSLIVFILLGFAIYLFFAGHNSPGGGFVGGLVTSGAILLLYMAYGREMVDKLMPINFMALIPTGVIIALFCGAGAFTFHETFRTLTFVNVMMLIFGMVELAIATIFDLGVYLTVLGTTLLIILNIAGDQKSSSN